MSKGELRKQQEADVMEYLQQKSLEISVGDTVRKNRTVTSTVGREQLFLGQLEESLRKVFKKPIPFPKMKARPKGKAGRILNLIISDTHYGSALDPREVVHKYGPTEEARRTAAICRQVAQYKLDHRSETELYIHLLGDIIQGQLHDMRDGEPLAAQCGAALRVLTQAIRFLAIQFPRGVTVFTTPGNHGRNTARHKERATNQKWDAIETIIYMGIKETFRHVPNVKVIIDRRDRYEFDMFGKSGFATHGDTVFNPGYPGRTIDVAGMEKQANKFNIARKNQGLKPFDVFIVGHVHIGSLTYLSNGAIVITNGPLIPPDQYAGSIGITDCACGQWIFESVPGHHVGDARFITVNETDDKDASLDSIIEPFTDIGG